MRAGKFLSRTLNDKSIYNYRSGLYNYAEREKSKCEGLSGCKIFVEHKFDDVDMDIYNLVSFAGIFVLIGFAWILSADKNNMKFMVILRGICLWFVLASLLKEKNPFYLGTDYVLKKIKGQRRTYCR